MSSSTASAFRSKAKRFDDVPESMGPGPGSYVYRSTLNDKKNFNKVSYVCIYLHIQCIYGYMNIWLYDVPESMGLGPGSYVDRSTLNDKKNFNKV
jgi:hypothetical protein